MKGQKLPQYITESEILIKCLKKEDRYKDIEDIYIGIFENSGFDNVQRFNAGLNIFQIDSMYNTKTKIEQVYKAIVSVKPDGDDETVMMQMNFVN